MGKKGNKKADQPGGSKAPSKDDKQEKKPQQVAPTPGPSGDPGRQQSQKRPQKQQDPGGNLQQEKKIPQKRQGPGGDQQQQTQAVPQWGPKDGQQQQRQPQQQWGPREGQQQSAPREGQQQQRQPQQQWGPREGQQQQRQPQQQWGPREGQQQQRQPQQQWGPREGQQQSAPREGQQQQRQPQQQWGPREGQQQQSQPQQQWRPQEGQQQQRQPQQQWGPREGQQQSAPREGQQQQRQPQQQWGPREGQQQQSQPQQQWRPQEGQQQQRQPQQQWGPRDGQQQSAPREGQQQQRQPQQQWGPREGQEQQRQPQQQSGPREGQQQRDRGEQPQGQQRSYKPEIAKKMETMSLGPKQSAAIKGIKADYFVDDSTPNKESSKFQGKEGSSHAIEANYVKVNMENIPKIAFQYDVKFEPDRPLRIRSDAFQQFCAGTLSATRRPKLFPIAFDGMNIAFSAERIETGLLNTAHKIKFVDSETNTAKEVSVTIMEAADVEVDLTLLSKYQKTGIQDKHIRAVQCLDIVLRTAPSKMSRQAGRAFYQRPDEVMDLGDGFVLWLGLFQSLTLGDYPMLNIDVAHKGFPRACNLLDLYKEFGGRTDQYVKNLNIIYDPPACMNGMSKLYKANGLVNSARTLMFENENGQSISVEAYYRSKNYIIQNPLLPCVSVGGRGISLPLELCRIQDGQDVRKKAGPNQVRNLIKYAATSTEIRKQKIMRLFNTFEYNRCEIIKGFNISLGSEFIKLFARNIPAPKIQYANGSVFPQKGSWRADTMSFLKGAAMTKWAILVTTNRCDDRKVGAFADLVKTEAKRNNMPLSDNYRKETVTDTRKFHEVFKKFKDEQCSIVFVIISGEGNIYAQVKQRAEIDHGILTQCVKSYTIERRMDRSTIANIFLKVNSKLNGTNHILKTARNIPINNANMAVMFLGADVTHPSPEQSFIPSVVGVVGSHDPEATLYRISWRLQSSKMEMIEDMEGIMIDQLHYFREKRGKLPTHIIYYRDGVSNGQFAELKRVELNAINRACAKVTQNYKPKVTCLVVQKRHHTRFFPASPGIVHKFDKNKNVLPGTVVDTVITHPGQKQFFLVSHESIQGTAKPSKYCVIRDDENFNADDLQAITYSLCHLFTRCNRSVSYPAPAYYAHHVAARGRVYIEGARIDFRNLDREYKSRNVDSIIRSNPMFFV